MQKIIPLELVGCEKLEYDLFNKGGKLLFFKGTKLTPGVLMKLCHMDLYKKRIPPKKKKIHIINKDSEQIPLKPLIKEKSSKHLLTNTRSLFQRVYEGEHLKLGECEKSSKIIIDEVSLSMDKIKCIEQLRIYDEYTYSHNINVSIFSTALGMLLEMKEEEIKEITLGAFLHDIGKMKIPKEILNKPASLEAKEFEIMKKHTVLGYKYIKENLEVPDRVARIALDHHEKYEGNGYPNGLMRNLINPYAQITNVVDVYDALISDRIYKKGIPGHKVLSIMQSDFIKNFNPDIFNVFVTFANSEELEADWLRRNKPNENKSGEPNNKPAEP